MPFLFLTSKADIITVDVDLSADLLLGLRVSIGINACMLIEILSPGRMAQARSTHISD